MPSCISTATSALSRALVHAAVKAPVGARVRGVAGLLQLLPARERVGGLGLAPGGGAEQIQRARLAAPRSIASVSLRTALTHTCWLPAWGAGTRAPNGRRPAARADDGGGRRAALLHYCRSRMAGIPINIADFVGGTPMVELPRMLEGTPAEHSGVRLFAKLEAFNPGGSVKDRIGVAMIEAAEAEGRIEPGRTTIVEATSGNTGIALAFVCAAKGYDLVLTLPQGMSRERESLLRLYGARVDITESMGGMNEAVEAARAMARQADVFLPDQFSNPANPEAHRRTTGPEIARALEDKIDVLVAGVGTGGTITGVGEHLREHVNPKLRVVAVEPRNSAVLSGAPAGPHRIQGIGAGFVPPVLNRALIDEIVQVSDDDAIHTAWSCAKRAGLLAGISCGAATWAALQLAQRPECRGQRIVVVMPDSGERYVSQAFFAP
jgi:cysteine synthase